MKKLMAFLVIGSFTSLLTVNETSCFCSKRKNDKKINIKTKQLDNLNASENNEPKNSADIIYQEIWEQVAKWYSDELSADTLKNDSKISLGLYFEGYEIQNSEDNFLEVGSYQVKITVDENDPYFYEQNETEYDLQIKRKPINISKKTLDNLGVGQGKNVYEGIYLTIGNWAISEVDADDIKNDNKLTINLYDDGILVDKTSTDNLDIGDYKVKITVADDDEYFKAQSETDYPVTVSSGGTYFIN